MRIFQVNAHDVYGGAEAIMQTLRHESEKRGHEVDLFVGRKHFPDQHTAEISHGRDRGRWAAACGALYQEVAALASEEMRPIFRGIIQEWVGQPLRQLRNELGHEDFEYPGSERSLMNSSLQPDLIHIHNLHGSYFDPRALESLSHQVPVFLTLHDSWLMTGHCSHPLDCGRWEIGCGKCPYLNIFPKIRRDASAYNLKRKRGIFGRSQLHVATPSRWLMDKLERSQVRSALLSTRVIPNGINLEIFCPKDRSEARHDLGLPREAGILVFAAKNARRNIFKDFSTIEQALFSLESKGWNQELILVVLGEEGETVRRGSIEIRFVSIQEDSHAMARYYQAADLYLHGAVAENYPTVIMEAMACGTPVIASGVGGVLEQIVCLDVEERGWDSALHGPNISGMKEATGLVVRPRDSEALQKGIRRLMSSPSLRLQMGVNALRYARRFFGLQLMGDRYHAWYQEVMTRTEKVASIRGVHLKTRMPEILLSLGHTARSTQNTGIQRVVRALARQCSENRRVRYVEWKSKQGAFYEPNPRLMRGLARFGGPKRKISSNWVLPWNRDHEFASSHWLQRAGMRYRIPVHEHPEFLPVVQGSWLVIPELMSAEMMQRMVKYGRNMGLKIAVIFHDAIAYEYPEYVSRTIQQNHEGYMRASAEADLVLAVSDYSAEAFRRFVKEKELISPAILACRLADEFLGRSRWGKYDPLETGPIHILCVATLEPRKNHLRLLKACAELEKRNFPRDWKLTLVGYPYQGAEEIREAVESAVQANSRIEWRRHVGDEELEQLYRSCHFSIFPSVVEGFGLPLVESLWNSRPCICSHQGSMGELAKLGGCLTVDVESVESIANGLDQMIRDEPLRLKLAEEAIRRRFRTWREYADEILENLRHASPKS